MSFLPFLSLKVGGTQSGSRLEREVDRLNCPEGLVAREPGLNPCGLDFSDSRSPRWIADREEARMGV